MRRPLLLMCGLTGFFLNALADDLEWHSRDAAQWADLHVPQTRGEGFQLLSPERTGIQFTNVLSSERSITNQIFLNGSGVAAGDVDGDGWCDLYFCGLDHGNKLFRNLGDWHFEDITDSAGVGCDDQGSTGCALADVDGDGDLDLLVNGIFSGTRLFKNSGQGRFQETTEDAGLDRESGAMSMALADVDGDGDLDLYVANYRSITFRDEITAKFEAARTNGVTRIISVNGRPVTEPDLKGRFVFDPVAGVLEQGEADVLYLNDGSGSFEKVSWTQGVFLDANGSPVDIPYDWGLSAMFHDLDQDGFPDLYVCNDFQSPDRIWLNDGRGGFRAMSNRAIRKTSLFSMGVDFADLNRDGFDEIFVADMLSPSHALRQTQIGAHPPAASPVGVWEDRPQYPRNTLFFNLGDGTYAECAQYSGLDASDWTWSPVFLDVDLDGFEDLLVTNGHERDAQNQDVAEELERLKQSRRLSVREELNQRKMFPPLRTPNYAFRNRGDLTFVETGEAWGFQSKEISHGMALADLDHDGDQDVVINCLNHPPLVYRNNAARPRILVRLKGRRNTHGIGARIRLLNGAVPSQAQEIISGGRYLSSDDAARTFAAGAATNVMTLKVNWPGGGQSEVNDVRADRVYVISEPPEQTKHAPAKTTTAGPVFFEDVSEQIGHVHHENEFDDFARQPLLPRRISRFGPGICWLDYDRDGFEDLAIGTGQGGLTALFKNVEGRRWEKISYPAFEQPAPQDQSALIATTLKSDQQTLLAGVSNHEQARRRATFLNQFNFGNDIVKEDLAAENANVSALAAADYDGDGDLDLFVGGGSVIGQYPLAAPSYIYRNDQGNLARDPKVGQALRDLGIVNSAVWTDLNADGSPELLLACEWGPLRIFEYVDGHFQQRTDGYGLARFQGWWNSAAAGDFNNDGRMDFVAGNWGINHRYRRYLEYGITLYSGDLNGDGVHETLETHFDSELKKSVPWRDLKHVARSYPEVLARYTRYANFGRASIEDILGTRESQMQTRTVNTTASAVFINQGNRFEMRELPMLAQLSPVFGLCVADYNGDGNEDVFLAQNFFGVSDDQSRYDAGKGLWLRGDGKGNFEAVPSQTSGIEVYGEGRGAAMCDFNHDGRIDLAVGQNGSSTKLYLNRLARPGLRVSLSGSPNNPHGIGARIRLVYKDNRKGPARELHAGGGWLSCDAPTQVLGIGGEPVALEVTWPGKALQRIELTGNSREIIVPY